MVDRRDTQCGGDRSPPDLHERRHSVPHAAANARGRFRRTHWPPKERRWESLLAGRSRGAPWRDITRRSPQLRFRGGAGLRLQAIGGRVAGDHQL